MFGCVQHDYNSFFFRYSAVILPKCIFRFLRCFAYGRKGDTQVAQALPLLPGEIAIQVQEVLSPGSIAVMGGAFAGWAVAHAFGVGAVADLLVGALGLAFLGWDALRGAKLLYGFVNHCMPPAGAAALDSAAQEFAELITLLGVDVVSMILLGRAFQKARVKLKEKPKVSEPKVSEPKVGEPKVGEPKVGEPKVGEPKVGEPKASEKVPLSDLARGGGTSVAARQPLPVGLLAGGSLVLLVGFLLLLRRPSPPASFAERG